MKSIIFGLVALASVAASAQDTTGCRISADGKYATCLVVVPNEGSGELKQITFKIRGASAPVNADLGCPVGEASYGPCTEGKVPNWLKDLNNFFKKHGLTAPVDREIEHPTGG